ncbi:ABC transporter ATP-binding protein [Micromonospora carbonacea]|uniref:Putative ABC transport system ATP-binding protein n=1 Tax=Micromonospora carbonacea TaxID=47853 RepID=A0A1C4WNS1_9ACTN|nr:ABC transporter ATP-binding protein [Micromonospora carbonacea]SCE97860.1 putative ABC transport system ATP-binding protein [Micromonospora carbonacea]
MSAQQQPGPSAATAAGLAAAPGAAVAAVPGAAPGSTSTVDEVVRVDRVSRTFGRGERAVHAVRDVSFTAGRGELVAVRGRSGAGKTTLLNLVGGLDRPDSGRVRVAGHDLGAAGERELLRLRRGTVGFVFQTFGLIPILSAAENVGVPLRLAKVPAAEREERVAVLLELVGLGGHAAQRPYELSGGQQQRVALARALANEPDLLIADEPTGQLDSETGRSIMDLLRAVVHARGMTALVATHDPALIDLADRTLTLRDGHLVPAP